MGRLRLSRRTRLRTSRRRSRTRRASRLTSSGSSLQASSLRTGARCLTTTSRRRARFTLCSACAVATDELHAPSTSLSCLLFVRCFFFFCFSFVVLSAFFLPCLAIVAICHDLLLSSLQ